MSTKNKVNFEATLAELNELVTQLESGQLSLEEALNTFEKGIKLTQICQQALSQAEQKIQILLQKNGQETLVDYPNED